MIDRMFAEADGDDARLAVVLAAGRADAALHRLLIAHYGGDRGVPAQFRTRAATALSIGLIDRDAHDFADTLRWLRNYIVHRQTLADSLQTDPLCDRVGELIRLAGVATDGYRSPIVAALVAGVVALEALLCANGGISPPPAHQDKPNDTAAKSYPCPECS